MITIGIDWADNGDIAMYSVAKRIWDKFHIIDSGKIEDFDYSKYVAIEHQIVGYKDDLEKFKKRFNL